MGAAPRNALLTLVSLVLALALAGCSLAPAGPTPTSHPAMTPALSGRPDATPRRVSGPAPTSAVVVAPAETAAAVAPETTAPAGPTGAVARLPDGFRRFSSRINPYSIGYPPGWRAEGDAFRFGDIRGDRFSVRDRRGVVSVNVLSEPLRGRTLTTEQYTALNIEEIRETDGDPQRAGSIAVDGEETRLVTWRDGSRPLREYEITQAVWTAGGRGWVVTLAGPPGSRAANLPLFRAMLATMDVGNR